MLSLVDLRGVDDVAEALPRPEPVGDGPVDAVRAILADVRDRGDAAVAECTARFDGVLLPETRVDPASWTAARSRLAPELAEALVAAHDAIEGFHRTQLRPPHDYERDGISIRAWSEPLARAGLYVPGGRAVYPSTVLMTAVPARVAGVDEVVLCVPPGPDGHVPDATLAAADIAGVDEVHAVGGAQAIGAMAYGTRAIRAVDVIVGPGNVYVALAKQQVAGVVRIPAAFAGPSEVVVVADDSTRPDHAAIDVVVQAEHGPGGLAWLVTWSEATAEAVGREVAAVVADAPRRDDITATLERGGHVALVDGPEQAARVVNAIAPEHLELLNADPAAVASGVRNAGAIFCGPFGTAAIGDYVAGPSHVLPTDGTARFSGALTVDDFTKPMHVVDVSRSGFDRVAGHVAVLARAEGLDAHARSVEVRRG